MTVRLRTVQKRLVMDGVIHLLVHTFDCLATRAVDCPRYNSTAGGAQIDKEIGLL